MGGIGPAVPSQALPQQNYQNNTYNPPTNFAAGAIGPATCGFSTTAGFLKMPSKQAEQPARNDFQVADILQRCKESFKETPEELEPLVNLR